MTFSENNKFHWIYPEGKKNEKKEKLNKRISKPDWKCLSQRHRRWAHSTSQKTLSWNKNERCPTYLKTKAFCRLASAPGEAPSLSGLIIKIIPPLAGWTISICPVKVGNQAKTAVLAEQSMARWKKWVIVAGLPAGRSCLIKWPSLWSVFFKW